MVNQVSENLWVNGGFYFDKDRKLTERHDLPFFGLHTDFKFGAIENPAKSGGF